MAGPHDGKIIRQVHIEFPVEVFIQQQVVFRKDAFDGGKDLFALQGLSVQSFQGGGRIG